MPQKKNEKTAPLIFFRNFIEIILLTRGGRNASNPALLKALITSCSNHFEPIPGTKTLLFYQGTSGGATWFDRSGNGLNATYVGSVSTVTKFGGGYNFPLNQATQYILLPEKALQQLTSGFNWTVNLWMEMLSSSRPQTIMSMAIAGNDNAFQIYSDPPIIMVFSHYSPGMTVIPKTVYGNPTTFTVSEPFMLTIIRVNATSWKVFKDGQFQSSVVFSANVIDTKTIGGWVWAQDQDSVKGGFEANENANLNFYQLSLFDGSLTDTEVRHEFEKSRFCYNK